MGGYRDHTDLFKIYRTKEIKKIKEEENKRKEEEKIAFGDVEVVPMDEPLVSLPEQPDWLKDVAYVKEQIAKLEEDMKLLSEKMNSPPSFNGNTDSNKHQIYLKSSQLKTELQKCGDDIKSIGLKVNLNPEEYTLRENIKSCLAAQLQKITFDLRNMQETYEQSGEYTKPIWIQDFDKNERESSSDDNLDSGSMKVVPWDTRLAKYRHKQIRKIHKSMVELRDLFVDLARMVDVQGSILDRIDQNLISTVQHVETGNQNLDDAKKKTTKTTECWIALLIVVILFCVVVVVVLWVRKG